MQDLEVRGPGRQELPEAAEAPMYDLAAIINTGYDFFAFGADGDLDIDDETSTAAAAATGDIFLGDFATVDTSNADIMPLMLLDGATVSGSLDTVKDQAQQQSQLRAPSFAVGESQCTTPTRRKTKTGGVWQQVGFEPPQSDPATAAAATAREHAKVCLFMYG